LSEIASAGQGDIFVTTTYKLYTSKDNGDTWQQLAVFAKPILDIYPASADGYLYLSFPGDVIHRSTAPITTSTVAPKLPTSYYSILAYPNPFDQSITFEVKGPTLPSNSALRLFDTLGRQVRREEFAGEKVVVQRHGLEPGLYYFLMESEGKQIGVGKVIAR
jgi:hypothetical protein